MSNTTRFKSKAFFIVLENNILYCSFDANIIIDTKTIHEVIAEKNRLTNTLNVPFIIDFRQVRYFLKGAKELFFSEKGFLTAQPLALILNSLIIKTSINHIFDFNKTATPFKICVNEDSAEQWINKIIAKQQDIQGNYSK